MDLIYALSGKELYDQAIIFRKNKNYDNYMIYITMAANYDYQEAIDIIYLCDLYKKQNYSLTLKFYEETANNTNLKNSYSIHFLAYMYYNGFGVKENQCKAIELYLKSIEKGNNQSLFNLISITDAEQIYHKIIMIYEQAIENGDVSALWKLAYIYQCLSNNNSGINNLKKAKELYKIGIKNGDVASLYYLASYYESFNDNYKKYNKMIKLYEEAIMKGNFYSIIDLAHAYKNGEGVSKNKKKAIELFEIAIEKGYNDPIWFVAREYIRGKYVLQDYNKAITLYKFDIECEYQESIDAMTQLLKIKSLETEGLVT